MTITYNLERIKKNPLIEYMKDPHAMSWLDEYKAKRLAQRNKSVTIGMARHAVRNGCKYFIKVKKENVDDARAQLEEFYGNGLAPKGLCFYQDGKIFVDDAEIYTMLKLLYS